MAAIDRVTITGADDTTSLLDLVALSRKFPFVEWGFLLGRGVLRHTRIGEGKPRFPSHAWLRAFACLSVPEPKIQYALHFCGGYVRSAICGEDPVGAGDLHPDILNYAARVQLNLRGYESRVDVEALAAWMRSRPELRYIIQLDDTNHSVFEHMRQYVPGVQGLFDQSGGRGKVPKAWPTPKSVATYGYAGGIGPKTLKRQLPKILEAAGDRRIWIYMESGVRTSNDDALDLGAVERALEICAPYFADTVSQKTQVGSTE